MSHKVKLATIALVGTLALTGCGYTNKAPASSSGVMRAYTVPLPDGGTVVCVGPTDLGSSLFGASCDWEGTR